MSGRRFDRKTLTIAITVFVVAMNFAPHAQAEELDELLSKAGKQVSSFLEHLSSVKCTEEVRQLRISKKGKTEEQENSTFNYLLTAHFGGGDLELQESRFEVNPAGHKKGTPLLVTNGFATLALIFHPEYQDSFEFSFAGNAVIEGKDRLTRVSFRHIVGRKSPTVLLLRGREYPLPLAGDAWIDSQTGVVEHIIVGLSRPQDDIGLLVLRSDVEYVPTTLPGVGEALWLPAQATIEVETSRRHWINTHNFINYQQVKAPAQEAVLNKK